MFKTQKMENSSVVLTNDVSNVETNPKTNLELKDKRSDNFGSNNLEPLNNEQIEKIGQSIDQPINEQKEILVPIWDPTYGVMIDHNNESHAYTIIKGLIVIDYSVIVVWNGPYYQLYKLFYDSNFIPQQNDPSSNNEDDSSNGKNNQKSDDLNLDSMTSKLEYLSIKYSKISEDQIYNYSILLIKLALFSKSIVTNCGPNPEYVTIFNSIVKKITSLSDVIDNSKLLSDHDIESFLDFIINRIIIDHSVVFRGFSGPRSIEDIKSILDSVGFGLYDIPKHPTYRFIGCTEPKKSKQCIPLRLTDAYGNFIFPFNYYGNQLKSFIMNKIHEESISNSLKILVFLWNELNGLQDFVDEVKRIYG